MSLPASTQDHQTHTAVSPPPQEAPCGISPANKDDAGIWSNAHVGIQDLASSMKSPHTDALVLSSVNRAAECFPDGVVTRKEYVFRGERAWVKIGNCPWWPAQILLEKELVAVPPSILDEFFISKTDTLLRLYHTHEWFFCNANEVTKIQPWAARVPLSHGLLELQEAIADARSGKQSCELLEGGMAPANKRQRKCAEVVPCENPGEFAYTALEEEIVVLRRIIHRGYESFQRKAHLSSASSVVVTEPVSGSAICPTTPLVLGQTHAEPPCSSCPTTDGHLHNTPHAERAGECTVASMGDDECEDGVGPAEQICPTPNATAEQRVMNADTNPAVSSKEGVGEADGVTLRAAVDFASEGNSPSKTV